MPRIWALPALTTALLGACGDRAPSTPPPAELTTATWPQPIAPMELADEPFDFRWAQLDSGAHLGQERVCDLGFVGQLTRMVYSSQPTYPFDVGHRGMVRCLAPTGESWLDLVFRPEAAALAPFTEAGKRIRVRIVAIRGFRGHVAAEFVAVIGDALPARPAARLDAILAGTDFARLIEDGVHDFAGHCAIAGAGQIRPVPTDGDGDYPADATHRMPVACRHSAGEVWLDVVFNPENRARMLQLARGEVVSIQLVAGEGSETLPLGRYAGPSP